MKNVAFAVLVAVALAGCASTPLPSCDGSDKRPVNQPAQKSSAAAHQSCGAARTA